VGTGFHPELTGRENIFLNGAILGMQRAEIARKFDEIVAFAEVARFIDTPVKHYSSGMYMRLAFAVAAHLEPDILIVDEVLAVGDVQFQKKCLGKMGEVAKQGRTVLLVSHNTSALLSLSTHAVWLLLGRVEALGSPSEVISQYLQNGSSDVTVRQWRSDGGASASQVQLESVRIVTVDSPQRSHITVETPTELECVFVTKTTELTLNVSVVLYNAEGICVFNSVSPPQRLPTGRVRQVCRIPGNLLNDGVYRIRLLVVRDLSWVLIDHSDILEFTVHDIARVVPWYGKWIGAVRPALSWRTEIVDDRDEVKQLDVASCR
jgi:lipopolysaccharide transport system ATP-binding protein